jgi:hypothetical protein
VELVEFFLHLISAGSNGSNSVFSTITSTGGGGGGGYGSPMYAGGQVVLEVVECRRFLLE